MLQTKYRSGKQRFLLVIGVIMGMIGAWGMGYRPAQVITASDRILSACLYPLLKLQEHILPILERIRSLRLTMHELRARIAHLEHENEQLIAEIVQLYATQYEQALAQELADLRKRYSYPDAIGAHIMMKVCTEQEHSAFIDAGEKAGVEVDMVAAYNNCIIGKVIHVYPYYSKIVLITDPSCKIAAYCAHTGTQAIHEGCADSMTTQLTHINHFDKLQEGDMVLSSGQGLIFPHGFALGRIRSCKREGLWMQATVEPAIAIETVQHCVLFKKGQRSGIPEIT